MANSPCPAPPIRFTLETLPGLHPGLRRLLTAHGYAQQLGRPTIDLAVPISEMHAAGCDNSDLRWLFYKGYVDLATGTTPKCRRGAAAQRRGRICFSPMDSFFLTDAGVAAASAAIGEMHSCDAGTTLPLPCWDGRFRTLRWCGRLLKCYRQRASNQETILAAFQEEGWPQRIDNPLSRAFDRDPHEQLHDTLRRLNYQYVRLLRFRTNATAEVVFWEPRR